MNTSMRTSWRGRKREREREREKERERMLTVDQMFLPSIKERERDFQPGFLFPIITSLGFLNSDFVSLNKFIADRYLTTQRQQANERTDGLTPKYLTGRFCCRGNALSTGTKD